MHSPRYFDGGLQPVLVKRRGRVPRGHRSSCRSGAFRRRHAACGVPLRDAHEFHLSARPRLRLSAGCTRRFSAGSASPAPTASPRSAVASWTRSGRAGSTPSPFLRVGSWRQHHVSGNGPRYPIHDRELRLRRSTSAVKPFPGSERSKSRRTRRFDAYMIYSESRRSNRRLPRVSRASGGRYRSIGGRGLAASGCAPVRSASMKASIGFNFPMLFSGIADVREWYDDAASGFGSSSTCAIASGDRCSATAEASTWNGAPSQPAIRRTTSARSARNGATDWRAHEDRHSRRIGTGRHRAGPRFHRDGHDVVVLSRRPSAAVACRCPGTARRSASWSSEIDGSDVVINLAGPQRELPVQRSEPPRDDGLAREVDACCRSGDRAVPRARRASGCRRAPRRSTRIASTRRTTKCLACSAETSRTRRTPGASASTSRRPGSATFHEATTARTRKVALRSAMTMSPDAGGIFDTLAEPRAARPRRPGWRWPSIHLVDSPRGFRRVRFAG